MAPEAGIDVRSTGLAFAVMAGVAAVGAAIGFITFSIPLLFGALPASALLTSLGGQLVVAWPLDTVVWMSLATLIGRGTDIPGSPAWWRKVVIVLAATGAYGVMMSLLVEPTSVSLR